jgi:Flp pilus assembly protein CpaB
MLLLSWIHVALAAPTVPEGKVAVTARVDAVHGVDGLLEDGDVVDLVVRIRSTKAFVPPQCYHVRQAKILQITDETNTIAKDYGLRRVTFAVPPEAAVPVLLAQDVGTLRVALLGAGAVSATPEDCKGV